MRLRATALGALLLSGACSATAPRAPDLALRGVHLEVLASWSGTEQERFTAVLDLFSRDTGAAVSYTSGRHRLTDELDERDRTGVLPDVALLPQPSQLRARARAGDLAPLDPSTREAVATHFAPHWQELGSVGSELYGVWFKAANKSLVWYDVAAFERRGVLPPADLAGLRRTAEELRQGGVAAFALSVLDGWTLTDWFENLYLRLAGAQRYEDLANREIPWTDPSVIGALELLSSLLEPRFTAGGPGTDFEGSVQRAFGDHEAAMVVEGDFVAAAVTARTSARLGVDVDVFAFPSLRPGAPDAAVVGGGDVAVVLRDSPAAQALVHFLATPEAAAAWARHGGFVSPNADLDLSVYPDELTRRIARSVLDAGNDFHFDLSDLQPAAFGAREDSGLRAELRRLLVHRDPADAARRIERLAAAAHLVAGAMASTGQR